VSQQPFIIGVAGGTSSGKTTIVERLAETLGADQIAIIKLDAYYVRRTHQPMEERAAANYDHPTAFDWELLAEHLNELANGRSAPIPTYDYAIHDRTEIVQVVQPAPVIVLEGILVLWESELRQRFDLKVFVDTPADLRFIRRLRRDVVERGRTPESIIDQYLATVRPSHEDFIEPSRVHADVIIPEGGLNRPALDVLLARVRELASP
jgi:uridine kinase